MRILLLSGIAAAAVLATGAAVAQTAQPTPAAPVQVAKTITRAEVQARLAKQFARLDANHDGFITQDEITSADAQSAQKAQQRAQKFNPDAIFDRLDLNHDGKITQAEAEAAHSQHVQATGKPATAHATAFAGLFARADTNRDGVITRAEFDAVGAQLRAHMEHAGLRHGMGSRLFAIADANKDGRVSLAEAQAAALAQFDRADVNHDGMLTPQERQQARQLMRAAKPPR
jgi:Ca2+-binding EF-hand superfamily protein